MTIEISESQITQAALDICRAHIEADFELTPVEKVLPDDWGRNLVWRYRVRKASSDFPATLIVKVSKPFPHTTAALTRLHQKLGVRWTEEEKAILAFPAFQST